MVATLQAILKFKQLIINSNFIQGEIINPKHTEDSKVLRFQKTRSIVVTKKQELIKR